MKLAQFAVNRPVTTLMIFIGMVGLGMVLVYMVMASQFESYRDPFIIFLSVPFGIVGVIMVLALTGIAMSIITFISLILLMGLVVNNGIVLISYIGILRQRGYDVRDGDHGGRSQPAAADPEHDADHAAGPGAADVLARGRLGGLGTVRHRQHRRHDAQHAHHAGADADDLQPV